jgi:hypothetical protein
MTNIFGIFGSFPWVWLPACSRENSLKWSHGHAFAQVGHKDAHERYCITESCLCAAPCLCQSVGNVWLQFRFHQPSLSVSTWRAQTIRRVDKSTGWFQVSSRCPFPQLSQGWILHCFSLYFSCLRKYLVPYGKFR